MIADDVVNDAVNDVASGVAIADSKAIATDRSDRLAADTVLIRLVDYVRLAGIEVDNNLLFELTAIVREGCEADVPALFDWSLTRLNGRICDTRPQIASPMPMLHRGHIGYDATPSKRDTADGAP